MATGLIQDKMARPEGDELNTASVRDNIQMPPELQEAYERVVIAGMKVMFSEESHKMMLKQMEGPGSMAQKLGSSIAGLMLILFKESNETMPPQVMVPAGIELLMQAVDFMRQTKLAAVSNQEIGDAIELMIQTIMDKFGVKPEQLQQMFAQYDNTNVDAAAAGSMGGAAPGPAPMGGMPQQPPMGV